MSDDEILRSAVRESRLIITMDKDFGELVYRRGLEHTGVLLLRLDDTTGAEKAIVVSDFFAQYASAITGGFAVFQAGHLRIRPPKKSDESSPRGDQTDDESHRS